MIEINNLLLRINAQTILDTISCSIPNGRITTFIGKSGAGKTSLLRCIAGLIKQYEGEIVLDDVDLKNLSSQQRATAIGFVAQSYNLFPHMTIVQNCTQPLVVTQKMSESVATQKAQELLAQLGLQELRERFPRQLSGGQQQRIAIVRALLLGPQVLLLDEPTIVHPFVKTNFN